MSHQAVGEAEPPLEDAEDESVGTAAYVLALLPVEPLAVDTGQAARLIGVSKAMFFKLAASGQIGPTGVRLGKCVRYPLAELKAWAVAGMPSRHEWAALQNQRKSP